MEKNINYEMCKKCGGVCCKQNGCVYTVDNFKSMDEDYLKSIIGQGKISISGQPVLFAENAWTYIPYLRARNVNAPIVDLFSNGGECINLTSVGCALSEDARPGFGLLVEPTIIGGPCESHSAGLAEKWLYYCDKLSRLIKYYTNKELIDELLDEVNAVTNEIKKRCSNNIPLTSMEAQVMTWYYNIMCDKAYYSPEELCEMTMMI